MTRFKLWPSRRRTMAPKVNEEAARRLDEAKGELQSAVVHYHLKMDWARTLARDTLHKAKGRKQ